MTRHDPLVRVRHMAVDFDILWTILRQDLPPLIEQLQAIVRESS